MFVFQRRKCGFSFQTYQLICHGSDQNYKNSITISQQIIPQVFVKKGKKNIYEENYNEKRAQQNKNKIKLLYNTIQYHTV